MTIREKMHELLTSHGLWSEEADSIINVAEHHDIMPEYFRGHHWGEDTSAYPKDVLGVLWLTVGLVAGQWLKEHAPQHFARAFFEEFEPA